MMRRVALGILLALCAVAADFIDPNPEFLKGFWVTLPPETDASSPRTPKSTVKETPVAEAAAMPAVAPPPVPSRRLPILALLLWGGCAIALAWTLAQARQLLRESRFRLALRRAIRQQDYPEMTRLLRRHLHRPPGTPASKMASQAPWSQAILDCECRFFSSKIKKCDQ